jgi:hypothetical protein
VLDRRDQPAPGDGARRDERKALAGAARPSLCGEEGLAQTSLAASIAARAAGRSGVVAA